MNTKDDKFILGGHEFTSRFILGSGKFSLELVKACIEKAEAQIITLALRRANNGGLANILDYIPDNITLLPNTSGARNAEEAVRIARLSREVGCGNICHRIPCLSAAAEISPRRDCILLSETASDHQQRPDQSHGCSRATATSGRMCLPAFYAICKYHHFHQRMHPCAL